MPDSQAIAAVEAALLAPGAPFETEEALVLGETMTVFKNRPRSLRELVERSRAHGAAEAMLFTDGALERRWSFEEQARLIASIAAGLRDRYGVGPGDRVAILAANCPEWILTFWATVSLGAVAVGLNAWWTAAELKVALDDARPKVLVADARRRARLGDAARDVPTVAIGDVGDEPSSSRALRLSFERLAEHAPGAPLPDVSIGEDDPAVLLYTSGTTGRPKGALHSHRNVLGLVSANAFHGARLALSSPPPAGAPPPCVLVTSPLFHVSGLHSAAVSCLANGVRAVWLAGRFDAGVALRLIARERVTAWAYTAALLHRVVHHPDAATLDLSRVRQIGGGGSPIAPELQERARAVFAGASRTFGVGYGLTECTALATLAFGDELKAHPRSVGRPMPTVSVAIRDEAGRDVPDGVDGEIHIRSPLVMLGYWDNPEATRASILPGRWLRTGDVGRLEGGRLTLSTRKRDLILRGGENVYPHEIEQRLEQHPGVAEAAVIGADHPELGQEVEAIVVPTPGTRLDVPSLATWVAEALAYFKVPTRWQLRDEPLPRNATGKVLKDVLRGDAESSFVPE
jgi:long-chain acyl-CoA synthetase